MPFLEWKHTKDKSEGESTNGLVAVKLMCLSSVPLCAVVTCVDGFFRRVASSQLERGRGRAEELRTRGVKTFLHENCSGIHNLHPSHYQAIETTEATQVFFCLVKRMPF